MTAEAETLTWAPEPAARPKAADGAPVASPAASTPPGDLERAVARVRDGAEAWAAMGLPERIAVARRMRDGWMRVADRTARAGCAAKGIPLGTHAEGEEWFTGPHMVIRLLRLLVEALETLARTGNTPIGPIGRTADGRLRVRCFPGSAADRILYRGLTAEMHLVAGATVSDLEWTRARAYRTSPPRGRVVAVLGAGNLSCLGPMDVVGKLLCERKACVLKPSPVNAWLGPLVADAFAELVDRGFLAVVEGGPEVGGALCRHPAVDEVHLTGSLATHDALVWGPSGPERERLKARGEPVLAKPVTSELGGVSPTIVVPGPYSARELAFQAEGVAGAVVTNASNLCNSTRVLVLPRGWEGSGRLVSLVAEKLALEPARPAWYPGAAERYRALTEGRAGIRRIGGGDGALPWTLLTGLDPEDRGDPAFTLEPFCPVLSVVEVGSPDPAEFLAAAVPWVNDRLWGTLCATIVVHPRTQADPALGAAVERAITGLRYGTVGVNVWAAYGASIGVLPWGGHPSASLADAQSGIGWVHNPWMVEGIEKAVLRAPVTTFPKPPHFPSHRTTARLGRRVTYFEERQDWRQLPGVVGAGILG